MAKERVLTPLQEKFIEVLFSDACKGNFDLAKTVAGYSSETSTQSIIKALEGEIIAETKRFLSRLAPKAAYTMSDAMENPVALGTMTKIKAAQDILDRVGVVKTERIEVGTNGIFILPPKNPREAM